MGKLSTPEWILKGYKSKEEYDKKIGNKTGTGKGKAAGKTHKVKKCPKCSSTDVGIVLGQEEGKGKSEWECKKCKWKGRDIDEKEVDEEEFLKLGE